MPSTSDLRALPSRAPSPTVARSALGLLLVVGCSSDPAEPSSGTEGGSSGAETSSTGGGSSGSAESTSGADGDSSDGAGSGESSSSSSSSSGSSSGGPVECEPSDAPPFDYYQATLDAIADLDGVLFVGRGDWEYAYMLGPMCPLLPPSTMPAGVEPVCAEDYGGCPPPLESDANPACISGFCNLLCHDGSCPPGMECVSGNYDLPQCAVQTQGGPGDLPPFAADPYMGACYPTVAVPQGADVCVTFVEPCPRITLATYECRIDDDCPASTFGDTTCYEGLCRLGCDPDAPSCPQEMQCSTELDGGPPQCVWVSLDECSVDE